MVLSIQKSSWIRRQQCPCGDWKCFITSESYDEDSSNTNTSLQAADIKDDNSSSKSMISPYVGMVFKTDDEAFEYYGNFARKNGFSIRKERSRLSPNLGIHKRDLVCYRSGFASARRRPTTEHQRDRKSFRCGCDAKMFLSKELIDGVFQWLVVQFSNVHNHELLEDDQVRLLPAYRKINDATQERILLLTKAGFPINKIYKVLEVEIGNQGGKLSFVEKDLRNFMQNRKKVVQESDDYLNENRVNDVVELVDACKANKEGDPEFVYDVNMNEDEKVENIAWSYGDSIRTYETFGDVVYFDTSYRSIAHGMIFGAWLGYDNNGKTILFGCNLLQDETHQSFAWALQTFVNFMKGRYPHTILTDLDLGLRDAIASVLPNTKHIIPLFNILPKLSCWFSPPLGDQYTKFRNEFDALNDVESTDDFEFRWNHLVAQYGLSSDRHIGFLFLIRASWATPYVTGCFLAMMGSSVYLKSVEAFLKGLFREHTCLRSFFEQVGVSSDTNFQARRDIQYTHIRTCLPMEEHARNILTPFAFNALQHELSLSMQYAVSEMSSGLYLLSHFRKMNDECHTTWNSEDEQIHCSCNLFESSGILCRHALRVLVMKNYFQVPEKYFLNRWQRESLDLAYDSDWYEEFRSLSGTLFNESSVSKEHSNYVRRELGKLVNEVRNMPAHDTMAMEEIPSPAD